MMRFGDIYLVKKFPHNPKLLPHWVVLLYANRDEGVVFYQLLQSRIFKIFPNFASLTGEGCQACNVHSHAKDLLRYKRFKGLHLDIDTISFLNFDKYSFLNRETFICLKDLMKDNYFIFDEHVKNGQYKLFGNLYDYNKKSSIISMSTSQELTVHEKSKILDYYQTTK